MAPMISHSSFIQTSNNRETIVVKPLAMKMVAILWMHGKRTSERGMVHPTELFLNRFQRHFRDTEMSPERLQ
ncbi:hypothetical protein PLICRDRAFT_33428 [Plicaturopsis crispa FD-325 SS-3]|nr:hypothetical protein PLICRDRAFT_33428 [Plicaturopsis crispa FD-325 SS-3]